MKKRIDISVILCAYNEGNIIEKTIKKVDHALMETGWNYEIIVVDDGSLDDTKEEISSYRNKNGIDYLKVISYSKNLGKGNAFKAGFKLAEGDFIVVIDSDLDVDPRHIPGYVEALKRSDVAVASKWHPESHTLITLKRKFLSFGFNILSRLFAGIKLKDTQTGLKAFKRTVLERIIPKLAVKRYAFDLELVAACNHCGFRITELPVNVHIESIIDLKEILRMALDLFRVAYRLKILQCYQRSRFQSFRTQERT